MRSKAEIKEYIQEKQRALLIDDDMPKESRKHYIGMYNALCWAVRMSAIEIVQELDRLVAYDAYTIGIKNALEWVIIEEDDSWENSWEDEPPRWPAPSWSELVESSKNHIKSGEGENKELAELKERMRLARKADAEYFARLSARSEPRNPFPSVLTAAVDWTEDPEERKAIWDNCIKNYSRDERGILSCDCRNLLSKDDWAGCRLHMGARMMIQS
jgi:hypothetical protein